MSDSTEVNALEIVDLELMDSVLVDALTGLAEAAGNHADIVTLGTTGSTLTAAGDVTVAGVLKCVRTAEQVAFTSNGDAALAATANTVYHQAAIATSRAITLPTQAASSKGDFIKIILVGAVGNGTALKIGTSGEFFAAGSTVTVPNGSDAARIAVIDVADGTDDDFLNITGATNGDGGIGSTVELLYNGSAWEAKAVILGQGTGAVASATTTFAQA